MSEKSLADVLLHPVRWRIVRTFSGRELTTTQLRGLIDDVPVTTLYRHVGVLADAGVLEIVSERRVRGAVERTYRLDQTRQAVGESGAAAMSREEHRDAFHLLLAGLSSDFEAYLARESIDVLADHVNYNQAALYVTDEDLERIQRGFADLLTPYLRAPDETDSGTHRRLMMTTILLPDDT
ncbi:helix-turn-helix domain-containing protein [Spiractinospora alimapuensis]|uniref:helix-turn-helix domain-containing protein n=1 Tax=Spiractinospora alimapuensis TaxID=2820884 RepID=UPI001F32B913|nr:helix-turn-helix domain-containing protein [Spiractinospora alimapuensis]QVQ54526.1 helix-turn-helix domain-containing protein [Spiractinospora alimapuensis]